jgi:hypothetical protein
MSSLLVVIPLGVSTPGTPVLQYLKWCIQSFKLQKTKYKFDIVFSCDTNVDDDVKQFLTSTGYFIEWYDPFYYMRKGGIWKKIYDQWEKSELKYIAFSHYDDVWGMDKIQNQLSFMENNNLELSWSKVQIINKNNMIITNDVSNYDTLDKTTLSGGASYAFCHSSIIKKDTWFNSGIIDKIDKSSAIYEHLQFLYSHKLKGKKDQTSIFYHRRHEDSISTKFSSENEIASQQRKLVNYSLEQVLKDASDLNLENITKEIESSL